MRTEDKLQSKCVLWYNANYKKHRKCLIWIPNELVGRSNNYTKATCKTLGLVAGAPDLILFAPKGNIVFIELKTPKGKQSMHQKAFQAQVEDNGYNYYIVRSIEEFQALIDKAFA